MWTVECESIVARADGRVKGSAARPRAYRQRIPRQYEVSLTSRPWYATILGLKNPAGVAQWFRASDS